MDRTSLKAGVGGLWRNLFSGEHVPSALKYLSRLNSDLLDPETIDLGSIFVVLFSATLVSDFPQ